MKANDKSRLKTLKAEVKFKKYENNGRRSFASYLVNMIHLIRNSEAQLKPLESVFGVSEEEVPLACIQYFLQQDNYEYSEADIVEINRAESMYREQHMRKLARQAKNKEVEDSKPKKTFDKKDTQVLVASNVLDGIVDGFIRGQSKLPKAAAVVDSLRLIDIEHPKALLASSVNDTEYVIEECLDKPYCKAYERKHKELATFLTELLHMLAPKGKAVKVSKASSKAVQEDKPKPVVFKGVSVKSETGDPSDAFKYAGLYAINRQDATVDFYILAKTGITPMSINGKTAEFDGLKLSKTDYKKIEEALKLAGNINEALAIVGDVKHQRFHKNVVVGNYTETRKVVLLKAYKG